MSRFVTLTAVAAGALAGCTTALSTMQPAETLPAGGVHLGGGMAVAVPVTRGVEGVDAALDAGEAYANDPDHEPDAAEQRRYLEAVLGLALQAPGPTFDVMARYGLVRQLDVGLRYTTTGVHLDAKAQLVDQPEGWKVSLSVGYAHHIFSGWVFDVLEYVDIDDFERWDVEVPLIIGRDLGRIGKLWFGPKYDYGHVSIDAALRNVDATLSLDHSMHYVGGFGGIAVGYGAFHGFFELTTMYLISRPMVLGEPVDLGGLVVVPAGGVMARF